MPHRRSRVADAELRTLTGLLRYSQPSSGGDTVNWDAIGAVGQVLGSVAVFITLGYLAVQVRHQRQENRRALSHGRGDTARQLVLLQHDEKTAGWMAQANAALGVPEIPWRTMLMNRTGLSLEAVQRLVSIELLWWDFRL
jgi:hypothetical protein